jgi:glutaminyl-tRNA synthetase
MPTISGLRRRGYTPNSIRKFCESIGVAKRENIIDFSLLEFCLRDDLNKSAARVMAVLDPVKVVITNYPVDKVELLDAENNQEDESAGFRKVPFSRELYIEREDFLEVAPPKFFRLSIGNEVRLKNGYVIKGESVTKDNDGNITEIQVSYDPDSRSGSGSEASQRKVAGTLHWVSIAQAIPAEVRLYDRLFIDEAPDSHKEKNFLDFMNPNSLQVITAYVEPSLATVSIGDQFQFQRLGYFAVDKDSTTSKFVFNKTVGLKDAWEEKGKKDTNAINNALKDINKFFKVATDEERTTIREAIGGTLKEIVNYSLLLSSFKKNINNNKSSLLFANYILRYSSLVFADFDKEELSKLVMMSLRSESTFVRVQIIANLLDGGFEASFVNTFKGEIVKLQANPPKSVTEEESKIIEKIVNRF